MIEIEMLRVAQLGDNDGMECYAVRSPNAPVQTWCWEGTTSAVMFPVLIAGLASGVVLAGETAYVTVGPFAITASRDGIIFHDRGEDVPFGTWGALFEYMNNTAPLVQFETPA